MEDLRRRLLGFSELQMLRSDVTDKALSIDHEPMTSILSHLLDVGQLP